MVWTDKVTTLSYKKTINKIKGYILIKKVERW
jgi:ribosomal protein S17E